MRPRGLRTPKVPKLPDMPVKGAPVAAGAAGAAQSTTVFGRIKAFFSSLRTDDISKKVGGMDGMLRVGMWFGAGFAAGYLFKKYFTTFMVSLIAFVLILKGLEYTHVVTIHWAAFNKLVGLKAEAGWQDSVQGLIEVTKDNVLVFIAIGSGFLIGNHLG